MKKTVDNVDGWLKPQVLSRIPMGTPRFRPPKAGIILGRSRLPST